MWQRPAKITAHKARILLLIFVFIQVCCSTYFIGRPVFHSLYSLLFFGAGIGISVCLLYLPAVHITRPVIINRQVPVKLLVLASLLPYSYALARKIMDSTPLGIQYADMLPVIQVMGRRFLNGEWHSVYQPIPEIWNGIQPIYLPAMWLPFTFPLLLHFDMRWVTVSGIWLSVAAVVWPAWKGKIFPLLPSISLCLLLLWLHYDATNNVIRLTEEGVVFFYYSFMVIAILSRKAWLIGSMVAVCLLSRYAIIGWLPFAAAYLLLTGQHRFLLKITGFGAAVFLALVGPFGLRSFVFQLQLPQQYIPHAARVWQENPGYFYHSLGMAKFFGPQHIVLQHSLLVAGTFLVPLLFLFIIRKGLAQRPNVMLAGFQLSLTFFYNFLDVSYLYLYYTPVFVSLAIAGWAAASRQDTR